VAEGLTLVCPVRGRLKAKSRGADGLKPSEEKLRVEAIRHLLACGCPKENLYIEAVIKRSGGGRASVRADLVGLDVPVASIPHDVESILAHARVLVEVKRDNARSAAAESHQVKPMLDFAPRADCVALYWDDVEQRVYWYTKRGRRRRLCQGPLADLPGFGRHPGARPLTFNTIGEGKSLLAIFGRIEDILHAASIGPGKRFNIMLQLLLAKLYDEHQNEGAPDSPLIIQDFSALDVAPSIALSVTNKLLKRAVESYKGFLPEPPEPVADSLPVSGQTLLEVMRVLAPAKIVSMRQSVIQDFYMYFAKHIYKWDLAQYFTPASVSEFIVEVLNPRLGEHVRDPACGGADFLTSAFRRGNSRGWADYGSCVRGSDVSPEAIQVAALNMILNGGGETSIHQEDSLRAITKHAESCAVVICNPPFGTRIVECDPATLANFDLGHEWRAGETRRLEMTAVLAGKQESGILFAEACVRLLRPGGRFALVVPNGYLGNRSPRYGVLREWLLRKCRFAAIVGLPRFTFKGCGADVSASVIFCEKRVEPLRDSAESEEYELSVEVVDRVGWNVGDKRGDVLYRRDPEDGTYLLNEDDDLILDSDFGETLARIRASGATAFFPWLAEGSPGTGGSPGWTVSIKDLMAEEHHTLDPKRNSRKMAELRRDIKAAPHFRLGDIVSFVSERLTPAAGTIYRYVEIADVGVGTCRWRALRGWELPSRARHGAEPGDIFVGSIWSSVRKWFLAGGPCSDLVVTNGLHRLRLRPGEEDLLLDLGVGLCSEAYATQMRGFARGSDGLAEVAVADLAEIILPRITDDALRGELGPFVDQLVQGFTSLEAKVSALTNEKRLAIPVPPARPDHTSII
jgi:type I restriction enzyme M protein